MWVLYNIFWMLFAGTIIGRSFRRMHGSQYLFLLLLVLIPGFALFSQYAQDLNLVPMKLGLAQRLILEGIWFKFCLIALYLWDRGKELSAPERRRLKSIIFKLPLLSLLVVVSLWRYESNFWIFSFIYLALTISFLHKAWKKAPHHVLSTRALAGLSFIEILLFTHVQFQGEGLLFILLIFFKFVATLHLCNYWIVFLMMRRKIEGGLN